MPKAIESVIFKIFETELFKIRSEDLSFRQGMLMQV